MNRAKKRLAIEAVLQKVGVSQETKNFFGLFFVELKSKNKKFYLQINSYFLKDFIGFIFVGVLAENGRLNKLKSVFSSFESIMRAYRGEVFVEVTSAEVLFFI